MACDASNRPAARTHYDTAFPRYQRVGDVLGEANCIKLGDLALARSDHDTARTHYEEAMERYIAAERPWSIGLAHQALARVAGDDEERNHHVESARATWQGIEFDHLIAKLDAEFGAPQRPYQPQVPGPPLKGPSMSPVIQPP